MAAESADGFRELNVIVPVGSEHSKSQVLQHRREKEQSDHGEWDGCQSACPDSDDLDKAIDVGRCGSLACAIGCSSTQAPCKSSPLAMNIASGMPIIVNPAMSEISMTRSMAAGFGVLCVLLIRRARNV